MISSSLLTLHGVLEPEREILMFMCSVGLRDGLAKRRSPFLSKNADRNESKGCRVCVKGL